MEVFLTNPTLAFTFGGTTLALMCAALMYVATAYDNDNDDNDKE